MSNSTSYHEDPTKLAAETRDRHRAIASLTRPFGGRGRNARKRIGFRAWYRTAAGPTSASPEGGAIADALLDEIISTVAGDWSDPTGWSVPE